MTEAKEGPKIVVDVLPPDTTIVLKGSGEPSWSPNVKIQLPPKAEQYPGEITVHGHKDVSLDTSSPDNLTDLGGIKVNKHLPPTAARYPGEVVVKRKI